MKKLIFFFVLMLISFGVKAEQEVGSYSNSYFNQNFTIEAAEKDGALKTVYVGVCSKDSKDAFICISGTDLEVFKTSLELVRDKYAEWVKIAHENNVTELNKAFDIAFPNVNIAWYGTKWWFSFGNRPVMQFMILDSGKMVATWVKKATASQNEYIDETIYLAFGSVEDFNSLIRQLDYNNILNQLLKTKSNEDLFK